MNLKSHLENLNYFLCEKCQLLVIVCLFFSGIQTNPEEFREFLLAAYPKLRQGGGFELLKISGTTRSRELVLIPCPNDGYHVRYLKEPQTQIGHATIFIRPLQRNLNLDPVIFHYCSLLKNADYE